jgi:4a-hydroxytetrahydrobiopterin dehydratase
MSLVEKECGPCRGGTAPLKPADSRKFADEIPTWKLKDAGDRISREFVFKDFVKAMKFVNKVADLAEAQGHHPDFHIHWNKVTLELWTHKIGGLHENDFILAAKIDRIV